MIDALEALDAITADLEETDEDRPGEDHEASMGWSDKEAAFNRHLPGDDLEEEFDGGEVENEHGAIDDEPQDGENDAEPLLGARETGPGSQLGWGNSSNGHEDEVHEGPCPVTPTAARKRRRLSRSNVYVFAGVRRY